MRLLLVAAAVLLAPVVSRAQSSPAPARPSPVSGTPYT